MSLLLRHSHVQVEDVGRRLRGVVHLAHVRIVCGCVLVRDTAHAASHALVHHIVHLSVGHEFQTNLDKHQNKIAINAHTHKHTHTYTHTHTHTHTHIQKKAI